MSIVSVLVRSWFLRGQAGSAALLRDLVSAWEPVPQKGCLMSQRVACRDRSFRWFISSTSVSRRDWTRRRAALRPTGCKKVCSLSPSASRVPRPRLGPRRSLVGTARYASWHLKAFWAVGQCCAVFGTAKASICAHEGAEQGCKDDLEALAYVTRLIGESEVWQKSA